MQAHRIEGSERAKQLAHVARLFYVDQNSQTEIARIIKKHPSIVARLLKEAREQGVVAFDVDPAFGLTGRHDMTLSRRLRDSFALEEAIVVRVNIDGANVENAREIDDDLHLALANQTGQKMTDRITHADHVAVGSGRAVCQTVRVIRRRPPLRKDVLITPLCGRIWSHFWQAHGPTITRPLDADDAAFLLALAFENEPGTRFSQVAYPLFAANAEEATTIMKDHCPFLPNGSWRLEKPPRLALVGVGVINPKSGHRISDVYREDSQAVEIAAYLNKAAGDLKEVIKYVEDNEIPYFGDVTNRFFPSLHLPEGPHVETLDNHTKHYKKLIKKLECLNDRMVVVNWDQLREISSVIVIGGGSFKLNALWTLLITKFLNASKGFITGISTDSETARKLLDALEAYNKAGTSVQQWYKTMAKMLFPENVR